jgi:beta-fructofuranosidase
MKTAGRRSYHKILLSAVVGIIALLFVLETAVRMIIDLPAKTDFYSSIPRDRIPDFQRTVGLKSASGPGWIHLGWIAHPERETYRVYLENEKGETLLGEARYGTYLVEDVEPGRAYALCVRSDNGSFDARVVVRSDTRGAGPVYAPRISTSWRPLFRPARAGDYVNDHAIFRDREGLWRLVGITAFGTGDYSKEKYFAHASSRVFPPHKGETMTEEEPVADYGRLAWAPHVVRHDRYYMWYSPHRAFCAASDDGRVWKEEPALSFLPRNPQFRDPMVVRVADGQWLMYATARDGYYSSVDIYQSFDLRHWQYIRPALGMAYGAERAGAQASTESPFVMRYRDRYYLSFTYNNGSFFWHPLLLTLKIWPGRESYNDTLVMQSPNPYSFGVYRGLKRPSSLVARLRAHAPEYVQAEGRWYITSAGWPWVATITSGEVAVAELEWVVQQERSAGPQ